MGLTLWVAVAKMSVWSIGYLLGWDAFLRKVASPTETLYYRIKDIGIERSGDQEGDAEHKLVDVLRKLGFAQKGTIWHNALGALKVRRERVFDIPAKVYPRES